MFSAILHPFDDILDVSIALAALFFAVSYAWSQWRGGSGKASSDTIATYKSELEIVKQSLNRIQEDNKLKDQQIASLQGQINVLKEVPLVNIDTTLKEICKFNKNLFDINSKILERLNLDAGLAKNNKEPK